MNEFSQNSPWIFLEAANTFFKVFYSFKMYIRLVINYFIDGKKPCIYIRSQKAYSRWGMSSHFILREGNNIDFSRF